MLVEGTTSAPSVMTNHPPPIRPRNRSQPVSHMVIYRGVDGKPGYQQAEDIHDAVAFVEQMRNEEGVEQARIFRLEEVTFEYRPYYRVELSSGAAGHEPSFAGNTPAPMVSAATLSSTPMSSGSGERLEDLAPPAAMGETFDVDDPSTTINVDDHEAEAVGSNGARRGLFGR